MSTPRLGRASLPAAGFAIMLMKTLDSQAKETTEEDTAEEQFMRTGKFQMRMRKHFLMKVMQKEIESKKRLKKTQKIETQLIENFEKKEVAFLNKYLLGSNEAINNGGIIDSQPVSPEVPAKTSARPLTSRPNANRTTRNTNIPV